MQRFLRPFSILALLLCVACTAQWQFKTLNNRSVLATGTAAKSVAVKVLSASSQDAEFLKTALEAQLISRNAFGRVVATCMAADLCLTVRILDVAADESKPLLSALGPGTVEAPVLIAVQVLDKNGREQLGFDLVAGRSGSSSAPPTPGKGSLTLASIAIANSVSNRLNSR